MLAKIALTKALYFNATKFESYSNYQHRTQIKGIIDELHSKKEIGDTY